MRDSGNTEAGQDGIIKTDLITKISELQRVKIKRKIMSFGERQILYDIAYMWNLKKRVQMNLFTTQK